MVKQVDMLPTQYVVQQELMKRVRKWTIVCGLFMMFIIGVSVAIRMKATASEMELLPLKSKASLQEQREEAMAHLAAEMNAALGNQQAKQALVQDLAWTEILEHISNASVEGLWLHTMDISVEARSSKDPSQVLPRASVQLHGDAVSNEEILSFYRTLSESTHITDVNLTDTRVQKRGQTNGAVDFDIVMTVQ
jgi:hypothetical protein